PREAEDHVPVNADAVLGTPLEQTHILKGCHSFSHAPEDGRAQALEPWLNARNPRLPEKADLFAPKIRLDFVEEVEAVARFPQPGQHVTEVPEIEDVVDHLEVELAVAPRERCQLFFDPGRTLAPECHAGPIESAEGAVGLCSPPTPSRALVDERDVPGEF